MRKSQVLTGIGPSLHEFGTLWLPMVHVRLLQEGETILHVFEVFPGICKMTKTKGRKIKRRSLASRKCCDFLKTRKHSAISLSAAPKFCSSGNLSAEPAAKHAIRTLRFEVAATFFAIAIWDAKRHSQQCPFVAGSGFLYGTEGSSSVRGAHHESSEGCQDSQMKGLLP